MSQTTYNWNIGESAGTWWKNHGVRRESVKGPCIYRDNATYYIRRKRRNGFSFTSQYMYEYGTFIEPTWNENGVIQNAGSFTPTSETQESAWNICWQEPPIDERTQQPEQQEQRDAPDYVPIYTDTFTQLINSDRNKNLILAAIAVIVITAFVTIVLRK